MALAPYVDMASIVVATHKKKWNQWENLMLRMYAPDIYPNTEGNIGVKKKNVKIQVVCGWIIFLYYIYICIDRQIHTYIYIEVCIGMASNVFLFLGFFQVIGQMEYVL